MYLSRYVCLCLCVFGPPLAAPILFLLSPEVSGTSITMSIYIIYIYIYIYICQQHGGLLGGRVMGGVTGHLRVVRCREVTDEAEE